MCFWLCGAFASCWCNSVLAGWLAQWLRKENDPLAVTIVPPWQKVRKLPFIRRMELDKERLEIVRGEVSFGRNLVIHYFCNWTSPNCVSKHNWKWYAAVLMMAKTCWWLQSKWEWQQIQIKRCPTNELLITIQVIFSSLPFVHLPAKKNRSNLCWQCLGPSTKQSWGKYFHFHLSQWQEACVDSF